MAEYIPCESQNRFNNVTLVQFAEESFRQLACCSKILWFCRQKVFCLTIKRWVLDEAIDVNSKMILDLSSFDLYTAFILFLEGFLQMSRNLVSYVGDMTSAL